MTNARGVTNSYSDTLSLADQVNGLVDEYRVRCLWFLREDYYPNTNAERMRTLEYIARYGDRRAFQRARELRSWLSHRSNERSAGCSPRIE